MNEQSELLEQFLQRLRDDSQALPPDGLDPALADFARRMLHTPKPDAALRTRIWEQAMQAQAQPYQNGRVQEPVYTDKEDEFMVIKPETTRRNTWAWTVLVAAAACVIGVIFIMRFPSPNVFTSISLQNAATLTPSVTVTPSPTITPSLTVTPSLTITPSLTVTPSATLMADPMMQFPTFTSTPFVNASMGAYEYTIQAGDTLGYIIARFGYSDLSVGSGGIVDQVMSLNNIQDPNVLPATGMVLLIPVQTPTPTAPTADEAVYMTATVLVEQVTAQAQVIANVQPIQIVPGHANTDDGLSTGTLSGSNPVMSYQFTAETEGVVVLTIASSQLELVNLEHTVIHASMSGGGGGGGSVNPLVMQSIMTHFLVVPGDTVIAHVRVNTDYAGYSPEQQIPYELDIRLLDVVPLNQEPFNAAVDGTLNDFNPMALYSFEAAAGDRVTIKATGVDGFDSSLKLYDATFNPVGDISVAFDDNSGAGYDPEINQIMLPTNGRYYVLVTIGGGGYGAFKLELTKAEIPSLGTGTQEARFNSSLQPQFMFEGKAGQATTVNITLPEDASDYRVEFIDVHVYQNGALVEMLNHSTVSQPVNGLVLSANIVPPADGEVVVEIASNGKLTRPSQQVFRLEVALGE